MFEVEFSQAEGTQKRLSPVAADRSGELSVPAGIRYPLVKVVP